MKKKTLRLVLASKSPRRQEILKNAGFRFMTIPSNSSESFDENLTLDQNLRKIASEKIEHVLERITPRKQEGILLLSADTVVIMKNEVMGKPKNSRDAARMLSRLSGSKHCVKTAFSLFSPDQGRGVTKIISTVVGFRKLSKQEIEWYVQTKEPEDKAGGYAIQGLGQQFVNYLKGDLQNVIGLPLNAVKWELRKQRWNVSVRRKAEPRRKSNRIR